ncbi:MAG: glycosyl transferase family 1, partial [Methylobacteriaceae bacterium]|nr:glycosyl transferase family 1 [Methylobacteriaceae bacterium]
MRVLFLHQNFPGQFVHVARALARAGHDVRALTDARNRRPEIVPTARYAFRPPALAGTHPLARSFAMRAARGAAVAATLQRLAETGYEPDLVVG